MPELPETVVGCDSPDCDEGLNVLGNFLAVTVKPKRQVLVQQVEESDDPNVVPEDTILLGTKSGRGVALRFHDFDCFGKWVAARKGMSPVLEFHHEDEIYEPEDNRSPEELVEDGDAPKELLAFLAANDNDGEED